MLLLERRWLIKAVTFFLLFGSSVREWRTKCKPYQQIRRNDSVSSSYPPARDFPRAPNAFMSVSETDSEPASARTCLGQPDTGVL